MQLPSNQHGVSLDELIAVLGQSIGEDKARHTLERAAVATGIDVGTMNRPQALAVLEHVADSPGIVGVTARFGRSRLMLQWAREGLVVFE